MEKHEETYCAKCNTKFTCKAGDITNCQCYAVQLSDETKAFLAKTSFNCLCKNCLEKTEWNVQIARKHQFPTQKVMLIEGLHYYKEAGYFVFTELYHMLRGNCCKSGCRHCPYGGNI